MAGILHESSKAKTEHLCRSGSVRGLCRLCSQDSSYLTVHKDAAKCVHNPHPVELEHAGVGKLKMTFFRRIFATNVLSMFGVSYRPYNPKASPPDETGKSVDAVIPLFRKQILQKDPDASEVTLLAYHVDGAFANPDKTSTFSAEVRTGEGKTLYLEFCRYGDTIQGSAYHIKGHTALSYIGNTPR